MKKILFYSAMFFCISVLAYKLLICVDNNAEQSLVAAHSKATRLTPQEYDNLRDGDIILRRGFGFFSDYIAANLNDGAIDVTHAGIIVLRKGKPHVIHCLSSDVSPIDGIQVQTLGEFLKYSAPGKIIITRVKGQDDPTGHRIAKQAEYYLTKNIPFDHSGEFDDSGKMFCTELIWKILEKDLSLVKIPEASEARRAFFHSMMPMYDTKYFDVKLNQYKK